MINIILIATVETGRRPAEQKYAGVIIFSSRQIKSYFLSNYESIYYSLRRHYPQFGGGVSVVLSM